MSASPARPRAADQPPQTSDTLFLRERAETLSAGLPALLAGAEQLAATVLLGAHGRRRAGLGEEFWQYRPVQQGDEARMIDWRRSARSDTHFVRMREWQAAQSVTLWIDDGQSMAFASSDKWPLKRQRAERIGLALAVLLIRGGERVGLANADAPPRSGQAQLLRLADAMLAQGAGGDHGAPDGHALSVNSSAVFLSDFLGDIGAVEQAVEEATARGVRGALLQVLDPQEEEFPFDGRTIFESISGAVRHETRKAGDLRRRYLDRLTERKERLAALARAAGWQYSSHHTGVPAQGALLWLYGAVERVH